MSPRRTLGLVLQIIGAVFIVVSFVTWILPSSNIMDLSLIPLSSLAGVVMLLAGTVLAHHKA